jgi:hypothetical protein
MIGIGIILFIVYVLHLVSLYYRNYKLASANAIGYIKFDDRFFIESIMFSGILTFMYIICVIKLITGF